VRTWLVLAAVVAVAVAAATDALRTHLTRVSAPTREAQAVARIVPPGAADGFMGPLYYSDPRDECRLHVVDLPGFANVPPPKFSGCRFSLSPDGRTVVRGGAVWQPQGGLVALPGPASFELASPASSQTLHVRGTAPAFKPDGTLTYVRGGTVVEWATRCRQSERLFTLPADNATARCRRILLAEPVKQLVWLTNTRFAAADGDGEVVIYEAGKAASRPLSVGGKPIRLEVSPRRTFVSVWMSGFLFAVVDAHGSSVVFPPIHGVRSLAWSPDERWGAVASAESVYVFRANTGDARLRRLDFLASDLAWR
jgi:hypothetical protein